MEKYLRSSGGSGTKIEMQIEIIETLVIVFVFINFVFCVIDLTETEMYISILYYFTYISTS